MEGIKVVDMKRTILVVPGFLADTYSEIEASFIELCGRPNRDIRFLWLVPAVSSECTRFSNIENRRKLEEPVYLSYLRSNGIPYITGNICKYSVLGNLLLFRRIFKTHEIDAVYTHFGFERFWGTLLGKLWGKTTIWNEHWHSLGTRYAWAKKLFYLLFVDHFISVSHFITGTLPKRSTVHTVPNSISVTRAEMEGLDGSRQALRAQLGASPHSTVILMVAAFTAQKRHRLALSICERVLRQARDVLFVFLGEGRERDSILEEIKRLGLGRHFVLPGHVSNVDSYYSAADLCMFTSYNDAFGYTILEAMKYSLPVVAFANGGPEEIIRNGKSGMLVREGDVEGFASNLLELAQNPSKRLVMGKEGLRIVQSEYSRETWVTAMWKVLTKIAAKTHVVGH